MTTLTSKITAVGLALGLGIHVGHGMDEIHDMIPDAYAIAGGVGQFDGPKSFDELVSFPFHSPYHISNINYSAQKRESPKERALRDPAGFVCSHFQFGYWLDLEYLNLGDDGIAAIAPHLTQVASRVTTLGGYKNKITAQGIQALAPFLSEFINLECLILCKNLIDDEGLSVLGPNLAQLPKLKTLTLWNNNITDSGIIALIPHLPARISLGGVGCFLGDEGKKALQEAGFGPCGIDWKRPARISTIPQERRRNQGMVFIIPPSKIRF